MTSVPSGCERDHRTASRPRPAITRNATTGPAVEIFTYPPRVCDVPLAVDLGYRYSSFGRSDDQIRTRPAYGKPQSAPLPPRPGAHRELRVRRDNGCTSPWRPGRVTWLRRFSDQAKTSPDRAQSTRRCSNTGVCQSHPGFQSGKEMHERLNAIGDAAPDEEGSKAVSLS
jgi:hypothetical protein